MAKQRMYVRLARTATLIGESVGSITLGFSTMEARRSARERRGHD